MKKNRLLIFSILVLTVIVLAVAYPEYKKQKTKEEGFNKLVLKARPYEAEQNSLEAELSYLNSNKKDEEKVRYISYGYFIHEFDDIAKTDGLIVLELDADIELYEACKETGRPIGYVYNNEEVELKDDASIVIFRSNTDDVSKASSLNTVISEHIDSSRVLVDENGNLNLPYIYVKNDEYDMRDRLNSFKDGMFVLFEPDVVTNVNILKSFDVYEIKELGETEKLLKDMIEETSLAEKEKAEKIIEINKRIEELETIINEIYGR